MVSLLHISLGEMEHLNGELVTNGDLIHGHDLTFEANIDSQIIIVRKI